MHKQFRLSVLTTALCGLVTASGTANAQSQPRAAALRDAVERAVLHNAEIRFRHQNFMASTAEQDVARGGWRPRVDLDANAGRKNSLSPNQASALDYDNSAATLTLRQTLFDGFATSKDVERLGFAKLASYYELMSASDQLALESAKAYIDVLRYRELVNLARDNYATHADVQAKLESRVKAGVGRRVDLEQAAGRMALAESNWLTEAANLHDVTTRYQRLVGEMPADTMATAPNLAKFMPQRENYVVNTVRANPEFQSAVANIRAYRADLGLRKAANYPTLEFRASTGTERNRNGVSGDYRDSALQLFLNYNLYRGGSDTAKAQQYAAKLGAAYDLRDKACQDVRQTALIALNDVTKLQSQLDLLAQHELSTSKAREAYRQQFDIGQRSLLDLLDTENELFEARRALINAENDLQLARARVLTVQGRMLSVLQLRTLATETPESPNAGQDGDDAIVCAADAAPLIVLDKSTLPKPQPTEPEVPKPAPAPSAPPPAPAPNLACEAISPSVQAWIKAWNQKDLGAYLANYSEKFVPAMGLSRAQWESLRKKRVHKQGDISAVLSNIQTTQCEGNLAEVSFSQEYGSVDYRDTVEKTLALELVNGQWKILRETVTKGRTF
ncbi:MAG: hypothetical protein E6Q78_14095 [Rhodoferax sp.]|nr:MAG: hypothetical protein E6Q78_14095 [Rhodoferax sp.]